jgi:hypothetical protein
LIPRAGGEVGTLVVRGTVIRVDDGDPLIFVDTINEMKDGEIAAEASFRSRDFEQGFDFPITGGTGAFAGARGTVTGRVLAQDPDTARFTYNVLL